MQVTAAQSGSSVTSPHGAVEIAFGAGRFSELREQLATRRIKRAFVVGSGNRVRETGVIDVLAPIQCSVFSEFSPNPQLCDAVLGARRVTREQPEVVIGIGGGSALDVAKIARATDPPPGATSSVRRLRFREESRPYLVLVPTTSGTGSEVTRFATMFEGQRKESVDDPRLAADLVIADPDLTASCPQTVSASCALDATAQCVESLWALRSSAQSRALAELALAYLARSMPRNGSELTPQQRADLARASVLGGLAIDTSRTTAAHAFAYPTTTALGVQHGAACFMHLLWLIPYTLERLDFDCLDPRGPRFVRACIETASEAIGAGSVDRLAQRLESLALESGWSMRLGDHGVDGSMVASLIEQARVSDRCGNAPTSIDPSEAAKWIRARI